MKMECKASHQEGEKTKPKKCFGGAKGGKMSNTRWFFRASIIASFIIVIIAIIIVDWNEASSSSLRKGRKRGGIQ